MGIMVRIQRVIMIIKKNEESNDVNKIIKKEVKQKPFCAYFTLK